MARNVRPQPGQLELFGAEPLQAGPNGDAAPATAQGRALAGDRGGVLPREPQPAVRPLEPVQVAVQRATPSPATTLDEAIPAYLDYLRSINRSEHTLKSFDLDIRLLRGQLGNRHVGAIDTGHLRQFIAWVRVSRANTPNSLRRKVATLKNFFGFLHEHGYIPSNPADPIPYPLHEAPLPEFLDDDAAWRLVEATEGNVFWRALVLVLLDCGLKRDEALALRVADVSLDSADSIAGYLVVRETDAAKRLRSRRLPLSERAHDALVAYNGSRPHRDGESRIFDISVRGINFIVEVCGQRAGIVTSKPRLTPQVLRETFAAREMRARVQLERRRQAEGWNGEALQLLTLRHDAELLELLGLKEDPDTARKYRILARD